MGDEFPGDVDGFRLKSIRIRPTVSRKIACPYFTLFLSRVGLSLQCGSLTGSGKSGSRASDRVRGGNWGGWYGVRRLISDRMSYRPL